VRSFTQWNLLTRIWQRKRLIAIAIGVVVAGGPLLVFDSWLGNLVERQTQEDSTNLAKRSIHLAELRLGRTVAALEELVRDGVNSCAPAHVGKMRKAVLTTTPVKDIELLNAEGNVLCSVVDRHDSAHQVLLSEALLNTPGVRLELVRADADSKRFVRIRRQLDGQGASLAALVSSDLFMPIIASATGPHHIVARVHTPYGRVLTESAVGLDGIDPNSAFVGEARSERYGFSSTVVVPRPQESSAYRDLNKLSLFIPSVIAILILAVASLLPRRQPVNPALELQNAIEAGQVIPYYQPIVDICTGRLTGAEVLVRWRKPDGTLVLPGSFIPLAESSDLIGCLTRRLMQRVCADVGMAIGQRPGFKIAFNFTAALFADRNITRDVRRIFSTSPIALSQVVLELTEREPIVDLTETRQVIAALQGTGIRIAIDDVGTGHSGLSYMLKLGVDIIKIDKMFVDAIGTDRKSATIVETLVDLARNMRMDIVAEGVENFEQVAHLREIGIRSAQGYVFAPPLPGSAFLQLLDAIDPVAEPAAPLVVERAFFEKRAVTGA
jgi:sensor c-di-GMP phosphodiesterase-like protein